MNIISRFFIYVGSIFLVLLLTYGFVYWGDLFGDNTPIGSLLNSSQERTENPAETNVFQENEPQVKESVEEEAKIQEIEEKEIVDIALEETQPTDKKMTEYNIDVLEPSPPVSDSAVDHPGVAANVSGPSTEPDISELWKRARHSFHYRDYQASVENYKQLIARTEDNFDALEELGDVHKYYGKKAEAVTAYFEAATILVRLGKVEDAARFMEPLSVMDVSKARALLNLIEAAAK